MLIIARIKLHVYYWNDYSDDRLKFINIFDVIFIIHKVVVDIVIVLRNDYFDDHENGFRP